MALKIDGRPVGPNWAKVRRFLRKTKPLPIKNALLHVGLFLAGRIRAGIITGRPGGQRLKPNAASTIRKKGGSKPLIDTGTMLRSIIAKPSARNEVFVGVDGTARHPGGHGNKPGKEVAVIGRIHEFITKLFPTLPRRQFLAPVVVKDKERITKEFALRFSKDVGLGIAGPELL